MLKMRILFAIALSFLSGTLFARSKSRTQPIQICHTSCTKLQDGDVTLFIHGTVFPMISRLMQHKEKRRGLYQYTANTRRYIGGRQRLGKILHTAAPKEFPANSFYKYYWSGDLSFKERKKAAQELYSFLKDHTGKITIIAHSHGCNVALILADVAQKSEPAFAIERLILLAPPVQQATSRYVASSIFKRVYSFYSTADLLQVADPQGLQKQSNSSFFSKRTYRPTQQLTQARVLVTGQSPSHRDFILPRFFKQLPTLLQLLDKAHGCQKEHVVVNIPYQGQAPHFLEHAQGFNPRRIKHCSCHGKRYVA